MSPVEELKLKADIEDDFGLIRHGLSYSVAGRRAPRDRPEISGRRQTSKFSAEHLLDFEVASGPCPTSSSPISSGPRTSAPTGSRGGTSGDMFFAEVRHFEEIFRQGEQPAGGSARTSNRRAARQRPRSDRLAELQKEIINGTWKLVRRETGAKPTDKLAEDGKVLKEAAAIGDREGRRSLPSSCKTRRSKASLEQATRFMKDAEKHLTDVADNSSIPALNPALAAEQAAYQALLKLRAREFQVIRNNSRRAATGWPQLRGQDGAAAASAARAHVR